MVPILHQGLVVLLTVHRWQYYGYYYIINLVRPTTLSLFLKYHLDWAVSPFTNSPWFTMTFRGVHYRNSPGSGAEEVHGGGKGGLDLPGGAGAAAGDTKRSRGNSRVGIATSQGVVCMERPGQTGKTALCHHPHLWKETQGCRKKGVEFVLQHF